MAAANGGTMQTLQSHIEDMRSLTNCKICLNPFYEPYILACGHTYCYSCLRSWFGGQQDGDRRSNKNCPDCRATVHVQPAPNYALRDLTHMFVQRTELIAEDETVKEHVRDMNQEAALLAADRDASGLFQGMFKSQVRQFETWMPIHDHEDNVSRCPICTWEMEDGFCSGCGFDLENPHGISDMSDDDTEDEDDDDDDDESDAESPNSVPAPSTYRHVEPIRRFHIPQIDSDDTDGGSELDHSDMDHYDENDDFIDDENEDDLDDMDGVDDTLEFRSEASTQNSDGTMLHEEFPDLTRPYTHSSYTAPRGNTNTHDSDEVATNYDESDDDDQSIRAGPTRLAPLTRRRPVVISDDEEEEIFHNAHEATTTDGDGPLESENSSESSSGSSPDNSDEDSEESDDTAIPPQSGRSRRERLNNHRARRPDKTVSRAGRLSVDIPSRSQSNQAIYSGSLQATGRRSGASSRSTYVY
ncbi:E3 ubiquitin ligase [Neophaeococcomyces mojaviensis]|uniref:E3 ubiquitin ligase n=1 Tax=Neophaeococcomyces mojaviensis TaxID=3383035 RepID=A0ACC3A5K2_9EURO|nr:E3 ubiquitin ligase [Knufia sp. JES_112]